jgi:hypothetical protein
MSPAFPAIPDLFQLSLQPEQKLTDLGEQNNRGSNACKIMIAVFNSSKSVLVNSAAKANVIDQVA